MREQFELAAGSVAGADHLRAGRNSHDAFAAHVTDDAIVAVVCDGCGSGEHSEVGAKIGARLAARTILDRLNVGERPDTPRFWNVVQRDLLGWLAMISAQVTGGSSQALSDYFLFTVVATVITHDITAVAAAGDGVVDINDERVASLTFDDNAPPYLTYLLMGQRDPRIALRPLVVTSTPDVRSVVIATDGAAQLDSLSPFWIDDRYFRNPDAIRRSLFLLNRRAPAQLPDDTTIVAIRRK